MTYLQFHLVFILPPLLVLLVWVYRRPPARYTVGQMGRALGLTTLIAFLYTTPWDNYLVKHQIWWYGPDRVLAVWGYVPIEEYLFFILQPLLTGLWFLVLLRHPPRMLPVPHPVRTRIAGAVGWLALAVLGGGLLRYTWGTYMGLILVWAGPVLAGMWAWKGDAFWQVRRIWTWAVAVPTGYLWIADRLAIGLGIWTISPDATLGWHLLGLPVEEAVFFLVTNILCVQGIMLFLNLWDGDQVAR